MSKKWIHKDGASKIVDFTEVVAHYEKGWTDAVERKEHMTEAEIAQFESKVKDNFGPCPTCGHVKEPPAPVEAEVVELADDEPVEDGEEPVEEDETPDPYLEYTNAELREMIEDEGEKPGANAKKADLIKTLKFIRA